MPDDVFTESAPSPLDIFGGSAISIPFETIDSALSLPALGLGSPAERLRGPISAPATVNNAIVANFGGGVTIERNRVGQLFLTDARLAPNPIGITDVTANRLAQLYGNQRLGGREPGIQEIIGLIAGIT